MKATASKQQSHPRLLGQVADGRDEPEVDELLPDLEGRDEEVVDAGDGGRLEEELGLRAALLARDEHLGDRRRLGVGELRRACRGRSSGAAGSGTARRGTPPGEADEDRLPRVRVELQDVERGQGEDRARRRPTPETPPMPVMMTFSRIVERRAVDARQADRQDRDRDRRLHHLADLQARVRRGDGEDDAEEEAPRDRAARSSRAGCAAAGTIGW